MKFAKKSDAWRAVTKQATDEAVAQAREEGIPLTPEAISSIRGKIVAANESLQLALDQLPGELEEPTETEEEEGVAKGAPMLSFWKLQDASEDILRQNPGMHPSIARLRAIARDPSLREAYEQEYAANRHS